VAFLFKKGFYTSGCCGTDSNDIFDWTEAWEADILTLRFSWLNYIKVCLHFERMKGFGLLIS
jgi:hypothetical protein